MESKVTSQHDPTDEALCAQVAQGDRIAEEMLVMRYNRLVRVCSRPYFLAGGDSEDLIQEGMVGLLHAVREYRPDRAVTFRTFAETCIRNRLFSAMKAANRNKHTPLNTYVSFQPSFFDGNTDYATLRSLPWQDNPEALYIDWESHRERAKNLKDCLSGFEAEVLGLFLTGLSYSEIAETVARPPKSVDNAVQRIRRKLAQQLSSGDFSEC